MEKKNPFVRCLITVVIQPESIVHSMVRYNDGSVIAQMGPTDMRLSIAYALNYPSRKPNCADTLDLFKIGRLHFERPDYEKFPCLKLAFQAVKGGAAMQLVYNSANDAAVALFRRGVIGFWEINRIIADALDKFSYISVHSFSDIYEADARIKAYYNRFIL